MARQTKTPAVIDHSEASDDFKQALQAASNSAAEHSEEILLKYSDGETFFDLHLFERKTVEAAQRVVIGFIDAGRYLTIIKEHVPHGDWLDSLDRMNIPPRVAQKMIQASVKFLDRPGSKKVLDSVNSKANLLELLVLDEDEIEGLGEGETVRGINLDELQRMTSTELRKALREAREDRAAQERVLEDRQKTITKLETEAQRLKTKPVDEVEGILREKASIATFGVEASIRGDFAGVLESMLEFQDEHGQDQRAFLNGLARQIDTVLRNTCAHYGIELYEAQGVPIWQTEESDKIVEQRLAQDRAELGLDRTE